MRALAPSPVPGKRYRFVVRSAEEAANAIRQRLGEDARVLSVRQVEGEGLARFLQAPKLEVVAELPSPEESQPPAAETAAEPRFRLPDDAEPRDVPQASRSTSGRTSGFELEGRIWSILERAGLPRDFLLRVSSRPRWQELGNEPIYAGLSKAVSLLKDLAPDRVPPPGRRAAFFGSPGAGATTALCKQLANDVFLLGRPTCVMKLDSEAPNSTEGLAMYCEALGVPLVRSADEIAGLDEETTIYFDAPGSVLGKSDIERIDGVFEEFSVDSRVLVVNAAYERQLIQQSYLRAAELKATHVVYTHLDELMFFGKLWEFVLDEGLAPLFASTGQNLASDCERDVLDLLVRRTLAAISC